MKRTIDFVEGWTIETKGEDFDASQALARLAEGLDWNYRQIAAVEASVHSRLARENVEFSLLEAADAPVPLGVLACAFQWYAVSACNYGQLVGWLHHHDGPEARRYVTSVMPTLQKYRNKVAAHMAVTSPRDDNPADLQASVMTHIVYARGRLCAAAMRPVLEASGQRIEPSHILNWSLTAAHRALAARFWREGVPTSYQSLRLEAGAASTFEVFWPDESVT